MPPDAGSSVLTLNAGSSSLKFALFHFAGRQTEITRGKLDGIGKPDAKLALKNSSSNEESETRVDATRSSALLDSILNALSSFAQLETLAGVGHRVVHGGPRFNSPQRVTAELIRELQALTPLDPEHLPAEIELIEVIQKRAPALPQIVCFDTAFHHALPRVAQLLPLPRRYFEAGVRRYGFHGLSYQFLMEELERLGSPVAKKGRVVLAHLGNGASMAAVRDGKCIDTSMSFTPTAGLVMSSRTGDLDPSLAAYLARTEKMTAGQFNHMINHDSGLLGVSQISADMRVLLEREKSDPGAADAVSLFCYEAKKRLGAYAAALGGIDALVFAGGIGENCPEIRGRICEGLEFIGLQLDQSQNEKNNSLISGANSRVAVRVLRTDEEIVIARSVGAILKQKSVIHTEILPP